MRVSSVAFLYGSADYELQTGGGWWYNYRPHLAAFLAFAAVRLESAGSSNIDFMWRPSSYAWPYQ